MLNWIKNWWRLFNFYPKTIEELADGCKDDKDVSLWINMHIAYTSDERKHGVREKWQTAAETFNDRTGDCEDFSILASYVLHIMQYRTLILAVFGRNSYTDNISGHAVCVVKSEKGYYHISNWGRKKIKQKNFSEFGKSVYPLLRRQYFCTFSEERKRKFILGNQIGEYFNG
jgi:predicted transglutaminase-like cysteine proteinase